MPRIALIFLSVWIAFFQFSPEPEAWFSPARELQFPVFNEREFENREMKTLFLHDQLHDVYRDGPSLWVPANSFFVPVDIINNNIDISLSILEEDVTISEALEALLFVKLYLLGVIDKYKAFLTGVERQLEKASSENGMPARFPGESDGFISVHKSNLSARVASILKLKPEGARLVFDEERGILSGLNSSLATVPSYDNTSYLMTLLSQPQQMAIARSQNGEGKLPSRIIPGSAFDEEGGGRATGNNNVKELLREINKSRFENRPVLIRVAINVVRSVISYKIRFFFCGLIVFLLFLYFYVETPRLRRKRRSSRKVLFRRRLVIVSLLVLVIGCWIVVESGEQQSLESMGDEKYDSGEYRQAIKHWRALLRNDYENVRVLKKITDASFRIGDLASARSFLQQAAQLLSGRHSDTDDALATTDPLGKKNMLKDRDLYLDLICLDLLMADFQSAQKRLELLKERDDAIDLTSLSGDLFMLANDFEQAEHFYRKAHLEAPDTYHSTLKLATCLYKKGKAEEATALLEMVDHQDLHDAASLLDMAYVSMLTDHPNRAEMLLKEALLAAPEDSTIKVRMAHFYLLMENYEEAENILFQLMLSFPDRISYNKILANLYISIDRMVDAGLMIQNFEGVVHADDYYAEMIKGKLWFLEGYPVYGASYLQPAVQLLPASVNALYLLGMAFVAADLEKLGEKVIRQVLDINPDHTDALLTMASILYKGSEYLPSLEFLERVSINEPDNFRVYMLKGVNFIGLEEYDHAVNSFIRALAVAPEQQRVSPLYYLGLTAQLMGDDERAEIYFERCTAIKSGFADLQYQYTSLLMAKGRHSEAREKIDTALSENPENPYLYYVAAKVALAVDHSDEALDALKKGMEILQAPEELYLLAANIYLEKAEKENSESAVQVMNRAISKMPYSKDSWLMFAQLMMKKGNYNSAMQLMRRAAGAIPDSPEILANIAWIYLQTGRNAHIALEYARAAYDLDPLNSAVADTLGWAYYHNNALKQAYWVLNELNNTSPDNAIVQYHLGMVLYRGGDLLRAREYLMELDQEKLSHADRNEVKSILRKLDRESGASRDLKFQTFDGSGQENFPAGKKKRSVDRGNELESSILKPQWRQSEEPSVMDEGM